MNRQSSRKLIATTVTLGLAVLLDAASIARGATPSMPNFYARHDYVDFTEHVVIADANGDGIPDLLSDGVLVQLGNGDGTFNAGTYVQVETGFAPDFVLVTAVDLNHDGKVDLVYVGSYYQSPGGILVSLGSGDGTFQAGIYYPAGSDGGSSIGGAAVGDFNADGIPDIAQVGDSGVWLFVGNGDGTFQPGTVAAPLPVGGIGIGAADFNGDGKLDVAVGMFGSGSGGGNGFYVIFGNGNGTFQTPQHFAEPSRPFSFAVGKVGPNGHPGIAMYASGTPYTAVVLGDGKGHFSKPEYVKMSVQEFQGLAIGDINGDGIPDLVAGSGEVNVAYGTARGGFLPPAVYQVAPGDAIYSIALADLRNSGHTDIVSDADLALSVLLNQGPNKFEEGVVTKLPVAAGCAAAGDFNGDGKPDLAVQTTTGFTVLLGTGKAFAPFTIGTTVTAPQTGCLQTAADLNGDGILDLLLPASGGMMTYLGNGDGTFALKSTTAASATFVVLADFNHDGKLDFATGNNQLALGNGDGTFQTPQPFIANPGQFGYSYIAVGDINNDGWPDLLLTSYYGTVEPVYVGLNNHKGGFVVVPQKYLLGTIPLLYDVDRDGNLDLVAGNVIYKGNGKGTFTLQTTLGFPGPGGTFDTMADVNGDGIPDFIALGYGTLEIDLGMGNFLFAPPFFLGTGPYSADLLVVNLHGQNPLAGVPDIVLPDQTGGVVVLPNFTK